jgi:hypothetical protein
VDFSGTQYTLYPLEIAAPIPPGYDGAFFVTAFRGAIAEYLEAAGLEPCAPNQGAPDRVAGLHGRVTRMDPSSAADRYFAPLTGWTVFEADIQVARGGIDLGEIHARGVRHFALFIGDSNWLLEDAARLAGRDAARKIVKSLGRS